MKDNDERQSARINRDQIVTLGDLELFRKNLIEELKTFFQSAAPKGEKRWLRSSEVRKLLNISPGTLQNFRINGHIPFNKMGKTFFYKLEDVEKILSHKK